MRNRAWQRDCRRWHTTGYSSFRHRPFERAECVSSVWCLRRNDAALSRSFLHTLHHPAIVRRRITWSIAWARGHENSSSHHHQITTTTCHRHTSLRDRRRSLVRACMSLRLAILRLVLDPPLSSRCIASCTGDVRTGKVIVCKLGTAQATNS